MTRLSRFLPKFLRGDRDKVSNEKVADKTHCKIIFLDETEYFIPYKGGFKGQYVLDKAYEQINLFETEYFGLRYIDQSGQTHWLESNKTLSSQLKGCSLPYTFYFGVKFYPADPCKLKEELTRYQFFLQVKRDILHGRLPVSFDEAIELFAYAVQSELGDFDSQELHPGYVSEFQFVPNQNQELEERIAAIHRRLGGTIPASAELKFLDKVKWLDMYGVDLHPVMGEGNTEYFLGLTPTGIVVYKNKTKVGNYFWPRITKVTNKTKVFIIRVKDKINEEHTYAFELPTKAACKHLWKCCVEHHAFFRLNQVNHASSNVSRPFRSTAKHRSSGRQDRQNAMGSGGRDQQPQVMRVQSRRQARRALSDSRLNQGDHIQTGLQYSEGHVTMVVNPEPVKGSRHRSLPDLKGRESPTSTKSAPWETNMDTGLYTSGRESPVSVTQSENVNYMRRHRDSDSEAGHRRNHFRRGYDSDGGNARQPHHYRSNHSFSSYQLSRRSDYDSDARSSTYSSMYRRKYFPSSRKGSDNESDISFTRRRRRELDSGSESDISPKMTARQRNAKSVGNEAFEQQWQEAMQNVYVPGKENRPTGSVHSAPLGEARQKKMRRRRSKSPGNSKRPPEELRQHIEFDLLEPGEFTEEQMREIPYVNVETKAEPFKIKYSPKTRHRYRSPKRKSAGDLDPGIKGGYISEELAPPYNHTPQRTPEPTHKQMGKPGGYYSDTGSQGDGLSRNRQGQQASGQQYRNNQSNNMNTNSKPIPNPEDKHSVIDIASNSTVRHQHTDSGVVGAQELKLDLQGHFSGDEGQGRDPDEDRNRDSGLNSSQSSSSVAMNSTPRSAGQQGTPRGNQPNRMFGTQDAIARLYSSPAAGTQRALNQSLNQTAASANRNAASTINGYPSNQNGSYEQYQPPLSVHNQVSSSVQNYQPVSNAHRQIGQNSDSADSGNQYRYMNGGFNRPQQNYAQPKRTPDYSQVDGNVQEYHSDYRTHQNSNYSSNSQVNRNPPYRGQPQYNGSSPSKSFPQQNYKDNSHPDSNVQSSFQYQPNSMRMEQNRTQYNSGHQTTPQYQSGGENRLGLQPSWQYVGNGDVRSPMSQSGYRPSPSASRTPEKTGSVSPYTRSPSSSPSKRSGPSRQLELSPAGSHNQGRQPHNQSMNNGTPKVLSPDSAISSFTNLSLNNNNYSKSNNNDYYPAAIKGNPQQALPQNGTMPQSRNQQTLETNFSRTRTPAFGTSDIWTEL